SSGRARPAHGPHLAAACTAAEEPVAAVGFQARHAHAGRHRAALQHLPRSRVDPPELARVVLPGTVPELAVDPRDPGDEAAARDGAQDRPGLRIDLMDLPVAVLPDPERP